MTTLSGLDYLFIIMYVSCVMNAVGNVQVITIGIYKHTHVSSSLPKTWQ